ncbi:MAG: hypothetical protein JXR76_04520 [Deltaproteobacteria bacterium]|nr:hypothetical protein [Deltaproteobacteria bacterium]
MIPQIIVLTGIALLVFTNGTGCSSNASLDHKGLDSTSVIPVSTDSIYGDTSVSISTDSGTSSMAPDTLSPSSDSRIDTDTATIPNVGTDSLGIEPSGCGNGVVEASEVCDDGNTTSSDGCSALCDAVEDGFICRQPGQPCEFISTPIGPATPWQPSLDRALVALPHDRGVFLSWRLQADDDVSIAFHVYSVTGDASPVRLTTEPLAGRTNFVAEGATLDQTFYVRAVIHGVEQPNSAPAWKSISDAIPVLALITGGRGGHARWPAFGDLQGNGRLDYAFRYSTVTVDPATSNWYLVDETYKVSAFDDKGQALWTYDMGWSIETGMWYAPYLIHDLDQDGRAELIVKAGDDSLSKEALRDDTGRVVNGPEYLRIVDGLDGTTILAEADWPDRTGYRVPDPPGTPAEEREYSDYNRYSRNQLAIAHLDGKTPHVIVSRGTYGKHKVAAYRYANGRLTLAWYYENEDPFLLEKVEPGEDGFAEYDAHYRELHRYWGQGAHSLRAGDVDGDGKEEVVLGAMVLDDDGSVLWTLGRGDLDHVYLGDLDPNHPGLEIYYGSERGHDAGGMGMVDAATGSVLWINDWKTSHIHKQGLCADMYAHTPGTECYSGEADLSGYWLFDSMGDVLLEESFFDMLSPFAAYWDGDPQRELLDPLSGEPSTAFYQPGDPDTNEQFPVLTLPDDIVGDDVDYVRLLAIADVVGDFREEIIAADRGRILIYSSNIEADTRRIWLMQDPFYRAGVSAQSMGYYQIPQLGYDMATTPAP